MYQTFKPDQPVGLMDFVRAAKSCIREIPPRTLMEKLNAREDILLVDVREHAEYEAGHIKGAHLVPRGIIEAAAEVDRPIFYAVAVIVAGFLPIYVLRGPSGELFKPMADTMIFALLGSLLLTLTVLPVLCSWALRTISSDPGVAGRRTAGTGISLRPDR